ncbi:MAG: hypothetical protein B0W54_10340 [Cellvibrio sp. 79]|nr:MAG: hypothetical protein B0W54_10340 [Cellvibrio sp. 79]
MKPTSLDTLTYLREKYGQLLTMEEVAEVLRYKTVAAVRKAHARKTLPINLYRFNGRSGYLARVEEVAECIEKMGLSQPVPACLKCGRFDMT